MNRVTIERVLCPIDFSEFSRDALDQAVALVKWYEATLALMYVIDAPLMPVEGLAGAEVFEPLLDRNKAADDVEQFARPALDAAGVRADVLIGFGAPAREIQHQAEQMHADVVVVGTHGRSGFQRFLLGSVTQRLLRAIAVPLLIVPPPVKKPQAVTYETILCPIDFSEESMRAFDYALSLAQESDARIILLHVLESFADDAEPQQIRNAAVLEYLRDAEEQASARLSVIVPDEARVWARPIEKVVRGRAYRKILSIAEDEGAGLIVMGVRGRGALNRFFFGSTTDRVIREARCPVLTLHADGSAVVDALPATSRPL